MPGIPFLAVVVPLVLAVISFNAYTAKQSSFPVLYIEGDISSMYEKKDIRNIAYTYADGNQTFSGVATLKVQGNSSLAYEKKNYTIQFYKDSSYDEKQKIDVGWGAQSKYCLKANWIDKTHARNIVTARLISEIQEKYNVLNEAPRNGAVDGFPIEVYTNGEFLGLYTMNIPKDAWLFGMDTSNPNHILVCGEDWTNSVLFLGEPNFVEWELEVGEENEETLSKLKELFEFIMYSSNEDFKTHIEEHLDLDATLNYYIMLDFAHLRDNLGKNMLLATYDGQKWYPCLYDLDISWGVDYRGTSEYNYESEGVIVFGNLLFNRIETCFSEELTQRYTELRRKILTPKHVMKEFQSFGAMIPEETFQKEQARWGDNIPGFGYDQIEEYMETVIPILDKKYADLSTYISEQNQMGTMFFSTLDETEQQAYTGVFEQYAILKEYHDGVRVFDADAVIGN